MRTKRAFTLIEISVVVLIIGILSTIVFVNATKSKSRSRHAKVSSDMATIANAARLYREETGKWPLDGYPANLPPQNIYGADPDSIFKIYLSDYPQSPCGDESYAYDWENWIGLSEDSIIRVTYRKNDISQLPIYYYCISSNGQCVDSNMAGNTTVGMGVDIKTVDEVTCQE